MNKYLKADAWCIVEEGFDPSKHAELGEHLLHWQRPVWPACQFRGRLQRRPHAWQLRGWGVTPTAPVGWWKNGYPEYFAKVLNATNWTRTDIVVNGQALDLNVAKSIEGFKRVLDMRRGLLQRTCTVELQDGAKSNWRRSDSSAWLPQTAQPWRSRVTPLHGVKTLNSNPRWMETCPTRTPRDDSFLAPRGARIMLGLGTSVLWNTTEKTKFTVACAQAVSLRGRLGLI